MRSPILNRMVRDIAVEMLHRHTKTCREHLQTRALYATWHAQSHIWEVILSTKHFGRHVRHRSGAFLVILQILREVADTERDRFVCFRGARFSVKFSLVLQWGFVRRLIIR